MGFKTINGKKVFIDDNRRSSGSGHNDESEGMKIGNGTRVPKMEMQGIPDPDPFAGGQEILDTLQAPLSDVDGVNFFERTKITNFLLEEDDKVSFRKDFPDNPNNVDFLVVKINRGSDLFEAFFFVAGQPTPALTEKDIPVDLLSRVLLNGLGYK
jgi:hypothetical protein